MDLQSKKKACKHFGLYVGVLAVCVPLLLVTVFNGFYPITENNNISLFVFLLVAVAAYPYVAYTFYDENIDASKVRYVDYSLYVSGLITLLLVGYIVHHTGGLSHSIFTFFFFFFPSAVAIAFEASFGLAIVCVTSFISVSINLYSGPAKVSQNFGAVFESTQYMILYILFVAIHLSVIYLLETNSIKRTSQGEK